jgi:CelD/BcsL family acetyltransferase involved in cellulose biosynthesis
MIDPTTDPRWVDLVEREQSDVFHSPEWIRVLSRTYGFQPQAVVVSEGDWVTAGAAFFEIDDARGSRIVSLPFSDSCDPIVSTRQQWDGIVTALASRGRPIRIRVLHNDIPLEDDRFQLVSRARWHGIELGGDTDTAWASIDSGARRAVRKAWKEGVTARPARGAEELRIFFDLHLRTRKEKYRLLSQPYAFFENIWEEFVETDQGVLMVSVHDDRIIGGIFFLEWKGVLHYKFNASEREFMALRPNDVALWTAIEMGIERGNSIIDFGLSDWDQEGLLRYKRKYASMERTISMLQYVPKGVETDLPSDIGELLSGVTDLMTRDDVTNEVTERAGELLYGYFA